MSNNPYQPTSEAVSGTSMNLVNVARYQKGIIFCILFNLLGYGLPFFLPDGLLIFFSLLLVGTAIGSLVYTVMLATQVYSTGLAILMGILAIVPCVGLIVLLIINGKATSVLRAKGIKVGLFGANMSSLPRQ